MVESISSSTAILHNKFPRSHDDDDNSVGANSAKKSFGPAVSVSLSDEAKAQLQQNKDIFSGLSKEQTQQLYGALGKIDKLFQSVGESEPTEKQEKQLQALEKEIVDIIGEEKANKLFGADEEDDPFADLSGEDAKAFEGILNGIDKIFEKAGNKPLNTQQKQELETLAKKADALLGSDASKVFREDLDEAIKEHK